MKRIALLLLVSAAFAIPKTEGQAPATGDLNGTWYLSSDEDSPCRILQRRRESRALFINEKGEQSEGFIQGDRIHVPRWGEPGRGGLRGRLKAGDTILW